MTRAALPLTLGAVALATPVAARAQGYRATFDAQAQTVEWRGWQVDSIPSSDVVTRPDGSLFTPDGIAVDCGAGRAWCWFYRPGATQAAAPMALTTDVTAWGFGVKGLSVRGNFRLHYDGRGSATGWPGQEPSLQLWEAYLDYQRSGLQARAGRQIMDLRVGWISFDGARATVRFPKAGIELTGFGGWGLARAAAVPVSDPVTAPLNDFIPPQRTVTAGAVAAWTTAPAEVRAEYVREVDPSTKSYALHMAALSTTVRPAPRWMVTGGLEYDIAQDLLGSADLSVRYALPALQVAGGYRRYRPIFPLWSIWSAFSPVPYNSALGSAVYAPRPWLQLRGRIEYYRFESAGGDSPLFPNEQDGWRWSAGGTVTRLRDWTFDAGYTWERGTGAGVLGWDGSVRWDVRSDLALKASGALMKRPLAYRFSDANVLWFGGDVMWRVTPAWNVIMSAAWFDEDRERPDAAAFEWSQTRLSARITYTLGSGDARRRSVPPVIDRMPSMIGIGR